jgi:hypothetical protein
VTLTPVLAQHELPLSFAATESRPISTDLARELSTFDEFGKKTRVLSTQAKTFSGEAVTIPTFVNEFWTAKQRAANNLHEISYRACFKPQLPRFFVERATSPGDVVYDPFMGRGTTLIEAALLGRVPAGCDVNPLSLTLTRPRINPPRQEEVVERLAQIDFARQGELPEDLLVFYHPETLKRICALKLYLEERRRTSGWDHVDDWISLVALNRLTGHSPGFFSVYTLPPNQAVSIKSQRRINEQRKQTPPVRDVAAIIAKKSRSLLSDCNEETRRQLSDVARHARLVTGLCSHTPEIESASVALAVTSPPFLDIVDYAGDNWLRCWFLGIDARSVKITVPSGLDAWQEQMTKVFQELYRVVKPGGYVAFEVGEVRKGSVRLEEAVVPCGIEAGFTSVLILINDQKFTKTANCWGVNNNSGGTNTNRIVVFRK